MKKIKIGTIILALTLAFVPVSMASENGASSKLIYQAVGKYKSGNFVGCIQDMNAVIDSGVKSDIAYYYQGLSYARLGFNDQAKAAYEEAAKISKNLSIIEYSNQGIKSLGSDGGGSSSKKEGEEAGEDIGVFIKSRKFLHEDIEKEMRNKAIEDVKVKINKDKAPTPEDLKYINQNIPAPTDKEIADAVRTFARLGINPMMGYGNQIYGNNPALMQTGALLQAYGSQNNNNNNFMNLAPYLLSMNTNGGNNTEVNKNMIQAMMLNQMLPNLSFTSDDK